MMMRQRRTRRGNGFTLIELMIVVAVIAVIAVIAAPSMRSMIQMQRLRSINAQLVTDLQFARNEAVSRNVYLRVSLRTAADGMTCYTLYTSTSGQRCDCRLGPGAACPVVAGKGTQVEVRTVQVPTSLDVKVTPIVAPELAAFAFDPVSGGLFSSPQDTDPVPLGTFVIQSYLDNARKLQTELNRAGRPKVCRPDLSTMSEEAC
jgi:type IV fimbrial biogenesis protein FimT